MAKIDNIDLGTVTSLEQVEKQTTAEQSGSMSVQLMLANMELQTHEWRFEGFLVDPTQSALESLENMRNHALLVLIDMTEIDARVIGYGKLIYFRKMRGEDEATIINYEGIFRLQPAIGTTCVCTANTYLHDLDYRAKLSRFDPNIGKFNRNYEATRLVFIFECYLDNYAGGTQDPVIEIQCGDDIYRLEAFAWKNSAWSAIGTWGTGGTAWGTASSAWTDQDSVSHTPTADRGDRGAALGIGTISLSLGCKKRILLKITNFLTQTGDHVSTKYGSSQLKLQLKLTHTSREALRPYPHITYISGGVESGAP